MTEYAIIVENVSKKFRVRKPSQFLSRVNYDTNQFVNALDSVSFSVSKGEMIGIIGLNGSGKTTLLRIIAGIYQPDKGKITVNGKIAPMLHLGTSFIEELGAEENIVMYGMLLGISKCEIKKKIKTVINFAGLQNFAGMKIKNYSSGMRARLAFSTALQINPDILLVDEVLAVGDQIFREKSYQAFRSFIDEGKTVLYTTHNLEKLSELSNRVIIIHQGKILEIGEPKETINKYKMMMKAHKQDENKK